VAKSNTRRRARSRKRRPHPQSTREAPAGQTPAPRPPQRGRGRAGEPQSPDERPQAPWHPLPLSELLILVGLIGAVVAWGRGIEHNGALLAAAIAAVVIGTVEFTLREHLSGFRSHTLMLAVIPAVVLDTAVVLVVLALAGHVPHWLNLALAPIDVALAALCFKLLRARYLDARRERTFAGLR
jgi:uncharacterized membrane-anchored protein